MSLPVVLFLDDMASRHKSFRQATIGKGSVHHVETAADAIYAISNIVFDQAFLDHDLSEEDVMVQPGQPSKVPTGMAVVDHIVSLPQSQRPRQVIVHSMNTVAAEEMGRRLTYAGIPVRVINFGELLRSIR